MRLARRAGLAAALAAAGLLAAQPASAQRLAGARPAADTLEGGMWSAMDKAEMQARASAELNPDPALAEYVRGVACKVAAEYCGDIRVYVMDRAAFNATMAPNGYMEVWSGLLLRATNEAELAFVLGHEASHFVQNHSVKSFQAMKTRANTAMALSVGVAIAGAVVGVQTGTTTGAQNAADIASVVGDIIYLGAVASYFSFSREQESEADALGFQRAAAAGYTPTSGAAIWRAKIAEGEASDFPRKRKQQSRSNIFDSHPVSAERIEALEALAKDAKADGEDGRARYRAAIRPHLPAWLRDELRRKDFGESLNLIERLAANGEDLGVLNFYRGEAYRLRRGEGDAVLAKAAYEAAVAHPDAPPAAWRELGEANRAAGDKLKARMAFEQYLAAAPQAQDRWLVEASLKKLTEGAGT